MIIQPKTGSLPDNILNTDWVTVEDVHRGPVHIFSKMPDGVIFCDIDGTVADLTHRRKYVASKPKNYPAFEKTMHLDTPIRPIIMAVQRLRYDGWKVVMCSGRSERSRDVTEKWLADHGIKYDALYMRAAYEVDEYGFYKKTRKGDPKPDYRRDSIVKAELLRQAIEDGFIPDVVFDDRDQVVEMWRENGIPCVQVAEGDF